MLTVEHRIEDTTSIGDLSWKQDECQHSNIAATQSIVIHAGKVQPLGKRDRQLNRRVTKLL